MQLGSSAHLRQRGFAAVEPDYGTTGAFNNSAGPEPTLIDQLEGELNLTGVTGCFVDDSKARARKGVRRQTHGHDIKEVEEFRTELQIHPFCAAFTPTQGRVLDESKIEVVEGGAAEGIAAEGAEAARVWPRPSG